MIRAGFQNLVNVSHRGWLYIPLGSFYPDFLTSAGRSSLLLRPSHLVRRVDQEPPPKKRAPPNLRSAGRLVWTVDRECGRRSLSEA